MKLSNLSLLTTQKNYYNYFSKYYARARFSLLGKKCRGVTLVMTIYFSECNVLRLSILSYFMIINQKLTSYESRIVSASKTFFRILSGWNPGIFHETGIQKKRTISSLLHISDINANA